MLELHWAALTADDLAKFNHFSCGDEDWHTELNEFLFEDALSQAEQRLNRTYVFYDASNTPVGYVTLCLSQVENKRRNPVLAEVRYSNVPALLIGRLAIDRRCQREGCGAAIMKWIRNTAYDLAAGCRFLAVQVDIENDAALRFYEREGFVAPEATGPTKRLQLLLYDLVA